MKHRKKYILVAGEYLQKGISIILSENLEIMKNKIKF